MDPIDAAGAARKLGRSRSWFYEHREELEKKGFPPPIPVSKRWDPGAIDAWKDHQAKMAHAVRVHVTKTSIDDAFGT
jgi:predicted DNA-binding transcriptional regulator AlpA